MNVHINFCFYCLKELLFNPIVEYQYDINSILNTWTRWICMTQKQFDLISVRFVIDIVQKQMIFGRNRMNGAYLIFDFTNQ